MGGGRVVGSPTRRAICGGVVFSAVALLAGKAAAELIIPDEAADRILVLKGARRLTLLRAGRGLASFPIALGPHPVGPKRHRGDGRTPEGLYRIDARNRQSRFHRSLRLSYPNAEDLARAGGDPAMTGGDICIHGLPESYGPYDPGAFYHDWTEGCIAVGNLAIEAIWARVDIGTAVEIRP